MEESQQSSTVEQLRQAYEASQSLLDLVNDILLLAKIKEANSSADSLSVAECVMNVIHQINTKSSIAIQVVIDPQFNELRGNGFNAQFAYILSCLVSQFIHI